MHKGTTICLAASLAAFGMAAVVVSEAGAQPRPVIERLEPSSGPPGSEVQIIGRRIDRNSTIRVGQRKLEVVRRLPNRWTVRIPEGAETGHLIIETSEGRFRGPRFRVTEVPPPPTISSIAPREGPPGTEVVIRGDHFATRLSRNKVRLGDEPAVVRSATSTSLRVVVPGGAASGPFAVRVEGAGEAESEAFQVVAGTRITDFAPRVGPPGTKVTIEGEGFARNPDDNRVYLGNDRMELVRARPSQLVVRVPDSDVTNAPILVDVRGAGRAETDETFKLQRQPKITGVQPQRVMPGKEVVIRGESFGADARAVRVSLGGRPMVLRRTRPNALRALVPPGAPDGQVEVRVHGLKATSDQALTVRPALRVARFEPQSGRAGTKVTIHGTGFSDEPSENRVTIGGRTADVHSAASNRLQVQIPSGRSGPLQVEIEGVGAVRTEQPFVLLKPPRILGFEPRAGKPGDEVRIRGARFGTEKNLVQVLVGGRPMEVRSVSDDEIVAVVPQQASTGPIRVSIRLQGAATSRRDFEVE